MTIIVVHGFSFDPGSPDNDPGPFFDAISDMMAEKVRGFAWYSAPLSIGGELRAIKAGYPDEYMWAYKQLAPAAVDPLCKMIEDVGGFVDVIGHSLGSRPLLAALAKMAPGAIRRMILLDGAEIQDEAPRVLPVGTTVLNTCVERDLVLKDLGALFNGDDVCSCIGQAGLGRAIAKWTDIYLDDAGTQARAKFQKGYDLSGAMPAPAAGNIVDRLRYRGDHWASYEDKGNWQLYRDFFKDGSLDWLTS